MRPCPQLLGDQCPHRRLIPHAHSPQIAETGPSGQRLTGDQVRRRVDRRARPDSLDAPRYAGAVQHIRAGCRRPGDRTGQHAGFLRGDRLARLGHPVRADVGIVGDLLVPRVRVQPVQVVLADPAAMGACRQLPIDPGDAFLDLGLPGLFGPCGPVGLKTLTCGGRSARAQLAFRRNRGRLARGQLARCGRADVVRSAVPRLSAG